MASSHEDAPKLGFIRTNIFSVDHKVIGVQYGLTALLFMLFGFGLMLLMRWQLAYPGEALPIAGGEKVAIVDEAGEPTGEFEYVQDPWFDENNSFLPNAQMVPEFYNSLGAMHGTIMIFLGVVPMLVGAFANYLVPLQIGAPDMAFPRMNMMSYWVYAVGGVVMLSTFWLPAGPPNSGWTSYPPLSVIATHGQTLWLVGMVFIITSSLLGSINMIVTIVQLRAPGLTFDRLPFFVWCQFISAFLLLLAFPPLEAGAILQLMDRVAGTSFYLPEGLVISGEAMANAGGGSPLLYQHLFWFLGHPEVYVLILPAFGIVAEVIANNTRKPLWGLRAMIGSALFIGFMSMVVWAHHMYVTGMGAFLNTFFEITTMIISVPSIVILTALVASLWGGSIRFTMPMLFALAFLPMFGIGGLTGLPLGLSTSDIHLHDTYYVIGHFHYVVAPGTIFAIFAGIYFWYPKVTGRQLNTLLGHLHFWPTLIAMNLIFAPMLVQGMAGMSRRLFDGGETYAHVQDVLILNKVISHSAFLMAAVQLFFVINVFVSLRAGKKAEHNPWDATTLEWATPSPPVGHGNFETPPVVYRGAYEYSVPGAARDFSPQFEAEAK